MSTKTPEQELQYGARMHFTDRAMAAYVRTDRGASQPSKAQSDVEHVDGKNYAVLRNSHGVVAVYRVPSNGKIRRLNRYPAAIEA